MFAKLTSSPIDHFGIITRIYWQTEWQTDSQISWDGACKTIFFRLTSEFFRAFISFDKNQEVRDQLKVLMKNEDFDANDYWFQIWISVSKFPDVKDSTGYSCSHPGYNNVLHNSKDLFNILKKECEIEEKEPLCFDF